MPAYRPLCAVALLLAAAVAHAAEIPVETADAGVKESVAKAVKLVEQALALPVAKKNQADNLMTDAKEALLPALRNPLVRDMPTAIVLARIAVWTKDFDQLKLAQILLEECDKAGDAAAREWLDKVKPLARQESIKFYRDDRNKLKEAYANRAAKEPDEQQTIGAAFGFNKGTLTDREEAIKWLTLAADAGNGEAMENLSTLAESESESLAWSVKAFSAGYLVAAGTVADIYAGESIASDDDIKTDLVKSGVWRRLEFHAEFPSAAMTLAKASEAKDPVAALSYYRVAAKHFAVDARKLLKEKNEKYLDLGLHFEKVKQKLPAGREPDPIELTVTFIASDGPCAKKLKEEDVVTAIDGKTFNSPWEFNRLVNLRKDGPLKLTFRRRNQLSTLEITPAGTDPSE